MTSRKCLLGHFRPGVIVQKELVKIQANKKSEANRTINDRDINRPRWKQSHSNFSLINFGPQRLEPVLKTKGDVWEILELKNRLFPLLSSEETCNFLDIHGAVTTLCLFFIFF